MRERLDAHVLTFPRGEAPKWVVYPVHLAESEARLRAPGGASAVPGPGAVLAESGTQSARVLESDGKWRRRGRGREAAPAQQELAL